MTKSMSYKKKVTRKFLTNYRNQFGLTFFSDYVTSSRCVCVLLTQLSIIRVASIIENTAVVKRKKQIKIRIRIKTIDREVYLKLYKRNHKRYQQER